MFILSATTDRRLKRSRKYAAMNWVAMLIMCNLGSRGYQIKKDCRMYASIPIHTPHLESGIAPIAGKRGLSVEDLSHMTNFEFTIKILAAHIQMLKLIDGSEDDVMELKGVIKILTDGQAYLRKEPPIGVRFFKHL